MKREDNTPSTIQPATFLGAIFAACGLRWVATTALGVTDVPRVGTQYELHHLLGPIAIVSTVLGGLTGAILARLIFVNRPVFQLVLPFLFAAIALMGGVGCGFGFFSAIWST